MYHRIATDGPAELRRWRVTPADFEQQLAYLSRSGYRSISLGDWLVAYRKDPASLSHRVVLTFDDAYTDFLSAALPLLQRYGFGATLFVPTWYVGGAAEWDQSFGDPAPLLSWEELARVVDAGVEIGGHTVTHPCLTELAPDVVRSELVDGRRTLESELSVPVTTFAYPYGDCNNAVERAVEAAGYDLGLTLVPEHRGPFALGRIEISGFDTAETFAAKMPA